MAIRIREVHVKAIIRDDEAGAQQDTTPSHHQAPVDMQSIVAVCVEQVMRKLREREER
jgi:hypothetical protein